MANKLIDMMVSAVSEGYTTDSVVESSLTWHPGSEVKVNRATMGELYPDGGSVSVPMGEVVSVVGVGGGNSGNDPHVRLADGRQAILPYISLGESLVKEDED